jgi:antirestriction protein ArdC
MGSEAKVQEITDRLLATWQSGDMPNQIAKTMLRRDHNERPSDGWSFGNRLLMFIAGTEDARGYRQWEQVGRHVVKGAKAFPILRPYMKRIPGKDGEDDLHILVGFGTVPVFRIEDTDGEPVVEADYVPATMPPLVEVAREWGIPVSYAPGNGRAYGSYAPGLDRIELATHAEVTFLHELMHAAHRRVLEASGRKMVGGQNPAQEIVAETGAAALCLLYGLTGYQQESLDYVSVYAGSTDPTQVAKAVVRVIADIGKAMELILDTADQAAQKVAA